MQEVARAATAEYGRDRPARLRTAIERVRTEMRSFSTADETDHLSVGDLLEIASGILPSVEIPDVGLPAAAAGRRPVSSAS